MKYWTASEIAFLRDHRQMMTVPEMAFTLQRGHKSVDHKLCDLGIRKQRTMRRLVGAVMQQPPRRRQTPYELITRFRDWLGEGMPLRYTGWQPVKQRRAAS